MPDDILGQHFYGHRSSMWDGLTWHNKGDVGDEDLTPRQCWDRYMSSIVIRTSPLYMEIPNLDDNFQPIPNSFSRLIIPDRKMIYRYPHPADPTPRHFQMVSNTYNFVSPEEAMDIMSEAGLPPVETMGALGPGDDIFTVFSLGEDGIFNDQMNQFLLADFNFGGGAFNFHITRERTVCRNTLESARALSTETAHIRHDGPVREQMKSFLEGIVDRFLAKTKIFKEMAEFLASQQIEKDEVEIFLLTMYPQVEVPKTTNQAILRAAEIKNRRASLSQERVLRLFNGEGRGMDAPECKGSRYGLYNAVVEKVDWVDPSKNDEARLYSMLTGGKRKEKELAWSLLTEQEIPV